MGHVGATLAGRQPHGRSASRSADAAPFGGLIFTSAPSRARHEPGCPRCLLGPLTRVRCRLSRDLRRTAPPTLPCRAPPQARARVGRARNIPLYAATEWTAPHRPDPRANHDVRAAAPPVDGVVRPRRAQPGPGLLGTRG